MALSKSQKCVFAKYYENALKFTFDLHHFFSFSLTDKGQKCVWQSHSDRHILISSSLNQVNIYTRQNGVPSRVLETHRNVMHEHGYQQHRSIKDNLLMVSDFLRQTANLSRGVARLSPHGSWDGLQPPRDPELDKRKKMDGWFLTLSHFLNRPTSHPTLIQIFFGFLFT